MTAAPGVPGVGISDAAAGTAVVTALGLEPLVPEGGLFRRVYSAQGITAIHYLLLGDDFSAMHRMVGSDELFFFHAGAPLRMLILDPDRPGEVVLGPDPAAGQQPLVTVPAGVWQGARSTGAWTLVSTVVAPGFEWSDFELAGPELAGDHPDFADLLTGLIRSR